MALELSRQKMRQQTMERFKYIRTCVLARELCLLVRTQRAMLNKEDVRDCCDLISKLCKEAGCEEPSGLCANASKAITNSEEDYLNICVQSCQKCGESRRPTRTNKPEPEGTVYV